MLNALLMKNLFEYLKSVREFSLFFHLLNTISFGNIFYKDNKDKYKE